MNNKRKILVVDDEEKICEILHDALSNMFNVHTAENGFDAFELFTKNEYCCIVTDITMPKMTGLELLAKIRKINSRIPVIIITGYATIENTINALNNGAHNFIQKPIDIYELRKTVKKSAKFYTDVVTYENIDKLVLPFIKNSEINYEFESDCSYTKEICHQICKYAQMMKFSDSEIDDLFFSLYEIVPNSVIHGNLDVHGEKNSDFYELIADRLLEEKYRSKKIFISCKITNSKITIVVEDQGNGFDINKLPSPTDDDNFFKLSGRGIFLSKFHVDSLEYNEKGNIVTIIKIKK